MKYTEFKEKYPKLHEIVAVSKTFDCEAIQKVFNQGFRHFGENKVQELILKQNCNKEIIWHFIGHLQSNKVKEVVKITQWIDSVDSIKLLNLIQKECMKLDKSMNILLQVKLTSEETKSGLGPNQLDQVINYAKELKNINLKGLMIIGPNTEDIGEIKQVFKQAHDLFIETHKKHPEISELSMGMSHDYKIAYEEGSTMFRIGSLLFGQRV